MKKESSTLKIIASTSVTLFSLFVCFVSTFAWFLAQRAVDADGNGFVTSNIPSKIAKVEIFSEGDENYRYNTTASATYENGKWDTDTLIDIGTYSSLDRIHTSLIVITLAEAEAFSYDLKTQTDYASSLVSFSNNSPTNRLKESGNPLSSVVRFSSVAYQSTNDYTSTNLDSKTSFVNKSSDGRSFPENGYVQTIPVSSEASSDKIALIVEYFPDALQYIYSINLGNDALNNNLAFACDWSIEVK